MNLYVLLISVSSLVATHKMDTVDYWHVLYNNKTIAEFNQNDTHPSISLQRSHLKSIDILSIEYGLDAPCNSCEDELYVLDKNRKIVLVKKKQSAETILSFQLKSILLLNQKAIDVYYSDRRRNRLVTKIIIKD